MKKKIATLKQASVRHKVYKRRHLSRTPALKKCPQVKGVVNRVVTKNPKKPNSATRHAAKIQLTNTKWIIARLPGKGYLCSKYNRVLARGGRANDLPGVGYTLIRGAFDFSPVLFKKKRRSIYGVERPEGYTTYVKKSIRAILNK